MTDFNGGYGTNPDYAGFPSTGGLLGQGGFYSEKPAKPSTPAHPVGGAVYGGGFGYAPLNDWPSGFPAGLSGPNAYPAAANFLLEGSGQAQKTIRQGYEDAYVSRIQGIAGAQNEMNSRMGAEAAAGGYSPDLIRKMMFSSNAGSLANIGAAKSEFAIPEANTLSQLQLGTGTELAGLKKNEIDAIIQAYEAQQGLLSAESAGNKALGGSVLGLFGNILGGLL